MCVKHVSYAFSMENGCKMAIKQGVLNMSESNLHSEKKFKW
jgi:hypothetical protein